MSSAAASGSAQVKSKLTPLEAKINKAGLAAPNKTISQADLFEQCGISVNQNTTDAINALLRKNLISMLRTGKGEVMLRFVGKDEAKAMGSMDGEEKMVFDQIKDAGNNGIWTKTITTRTGLPRTTITKVLKILENKKAVKTVKSVKAPTRKIYMLAGLTPSVELTGGPWFTDNELDTDFVDVLKKCAYKFLHEKSVPVIPKGDKNRYIFPTAATQHLPTVADVRHFIEGLNVAAVELHDEHVESLLELMVFDGTVEKVLVLHEFSGHANGNGNGNDRKRKQRPADSSDSEGGGGLRRSKSIKTGLKGKAGRRFSRLKRGGESDEESESSESDFDSDEDVEARRKRKAEAGEDSDGGKKSKRRRKKRVVRKREDSDDDNNSDASISDSDEDDPAAAAKKKKAAALDRSALDGKTDYVYRLVRPWAPVIGWTDMPCGKCPAEAFCTEPTRPLGAHHFGVGGPKIGIQLEAGMEGVGMMGGAGAAIGVSNAKWGEARGASGTGVAPVNPRDCHYFRDWLTF